MDQAAPEQACKKLRAPKRTGRVGSLDASGLCPPASDLFKARQNSWDYLRMRGAESSKSFAR